VTTPELKHGDLADITITGARLELVEKNRQHFVMPTGTTVTVEMTNDPGVNIVRLAPAEWPPQPGDLWRDEKHNGLWFVCREGDDGLVTLLGPRQESAETGDLARWGAIFVHRNDSSPATQEDAPVDEIAQALSAADVEINGGDYPKWCDLRDGGQDQYRAAARYALARYRITPRERQGGGAQ